MHLTTDCKLRTPVAGPWPWDQMAKEGILVVMVATSRTSELWAKQGVEGKLCQGPSGSVVITKAAKNQF